MHFFGKTKKQNIYKRDLKWAKGRAGELLDQGYRLPKNQIKIINGINQLFWVVIKGINQSNTGLEIELLKK